MLWIAVVFSCVLFFFSSRRRHTRFKCDWSSDVCSSDLLPIFQWLKYWHGSGAIIGVLVIPTVLVLAIIALPFLDRSIERRPWKRPAAMEIGRASCRERV